MAKITAKGSRHVDTEKEREEINFARRRVGLPILVVVKRNCLRCGEEFETDSATNKLCTRCRSFATNAHNKYWCD